MFRYRASITDLFTTFKMKGCCILANPFSVALRGPSCNFFEFVCIVDYVNEFYIWPLC